MKRVITIILFSIFTLFISAGPINAGYVRGYYKKNGTYVQPYYRSNPNGLKYDNYSWNYSKPLYNNSYGQYNTYKWNTPSWSTQSDYWSGLNSYKYNNSFRGYFSP